MNGSGDKTAADLQEESSQPGAVEQPGELLVDGADNKGVVGPDLEEQALAAAREAEDALVKGEHAVEQAHDLLQSGRQSPKAPVPRPSRKREVVLRALLGVNLAAMVIVLSMPTPPRALNQPGATPVTVIEPMPVPEPAVLPPSITSPVTRAFAAADRHDYATAIGLLDGHLRATPRMSPARKLDVLFALGHYATQIADFGAAEEYRRRALALQRSHTLPEDLVQMALEAERNGDAESMRRHYARLLLQHRQIPSSLERHVAEAYLKLGDSYRQEAQLAEEQARRRELEKTQEGLRSQAANGGGK